MLLQRIQTNSNIPSSEQAPSLSVVAKILPHETHTPHCLAHGHLVIIPVVRVVVVLVVGMTDGDADSLGGEFLAQGRGLEHAGEFFGAVDLEGIRHGGGEDL